MSESIRFIAKKTLNAWLSLSYDYRLDIFKKYIH